MLAFSGCVQQGIILHIPSSNLQNVRIFSHQGYLIIGHYFCHYGHASYLTHLRKDFQSSDSHTLKRIGRSAGFESASA